MRKMSLPLVCVSVLAVVGAAGPAGASTQGDPGAETLAEGIARINAGLDGIERSLEMLVGHRRVELLIRRIEMAERRFAPLRGDLRDERANAKNHEEEIARIESFKEQMEKQMDEAVRAGADPLQLPERNELRNLESMIELEKAQLEKTERRVLELEDEVARGSRRIELLDERLEEVLEALGE